MIVETVAIVPLTQTPATPPRVACNRPADASAAALCTGEQMVRQAEAEQPLTDAGLALMDKSVEWFRRAADTARNVTTKRLALARLEYLFDADRLDRPRDADPVLRELISVSPGDLAPLFRLAHLQERQESFDEAESTLLSAHQQKPDDVQPYRELAQFFARRAAAISGQSTRDARSSRGLPEPGKPDKDGVYALGGDVEAPKQLSSSISVQLPLDATAAHVSGSVALDVVIDETGRVVDARVLRSVPLFDDAALATVRQWRFAPATLDGKPIRVRITAVVNFP